MLSLIIILHLTAAVTVGLQPIGFIPEEGATLSVCSELTSGSLERDILVGLEAQNNTAIRTSHNTFSSNSFPKIIRLWYA